MIARQMWNFRCGECQSDTVVFMDNDRCETCDPACRKARRLAAAAAQREEGKAS